MSTGGSITRAPNGTWTLVVDLADFKGKRRQLRRRGFSTKREAQRQLTAVLADMSRALSWCRAK